MDRDKIRIALGQVKNHASVMGVGGYSIGANRTPEYANIMVQIADGKEVLVPLE